MKLSLFSLALTKPPHNPSDILADLKRVPVLLPNYNFEVHLQLVCLNALF